MWPFKKKVDYTEFLRAVIKGEVCAVEEFIHKGIKLNIKSETNEGKSPLMLAVTMRHLSIVQILCKAGADLDGIDDLGRTALIIAASNGDLAIAEYLILRGAKLEKRDHQFGLTALMFAACNGHSQVATALINAGADINCRSKPDGWTASMWAAMNGNLDVVRVLVDAGADFSLKDNAGETALSYAISKGHQSVVNYLKNINMKKNRSD
jgi:ankyrin repeat protein